ncbi:MAG TPA: ABC transporter ATP-binding protein [Herpetosiphonaceae bacterium]
MQQPAALRPAAAGVPAQQRSLISLRGVNKSFGKKDAVSDISLEIQPGEIFGIVGPSGCGKTTTVRMMTGVYVPDSGEISVLGKEPKRFTSRDRERLGYMPQLFVLYPNLTVMENLRFAASTYGISWFGRRQRLESMLDFVELGDARGTLATNISGGMKRRLQLAAALIHNPELLFADEPTAGVDPVLRGRFWERFQSLKEQGRSLVVTTQYVSEVAYCDKVAVMRDGELLTVDSPDGLRRQALGGEVISLRVDPEDSMRAMRLLSRHPLVRDVHRIRNADPGSLAAYVENAGAAMPELIQALASDETIDVRNAQEYNPPFDDIFITLMQRADEERGAAAEETTNG